MAEFITVKGYRAESAKGKGLGRSPRGNSTSLWSHLSGVTYHVLDSLTTGNTLYQGRSLESQGPGFLLGLIMQAPSASHIH